MISRALLASVALSTVIFFPIRQVGWLECFRKETGGLTGQVNLSLLGTKVKDCDIRRKRGGMPRDALKDALCSEHRSHVHSQRRSKRDRPSN
jgi:hypothetical protein